MISAHNHNSKFKHFLKPPSDLTVGNKTNFTQIFFENPTKKANASTFPVEIPPKTIPDYLKFKVSCPTSSHLNIIISDQYEKYW
mmetsp:Transcript_30724/g.27927  ORF Transcript_30724/g.27927 Transcript_30724/m.27927 type:complete len:84 (-) Transcript_30724:576-827(-)